MKLPYLGFHNPIITRWRRRFTKEQPPDPSSSPPAGVSSRFQLSSPVPTSLKGAGWQVQRLHMTYAALTYDAYLTSPEAPVHRHGCSELAEPYTWQDHMNQIEEAEHDYGTHKRFSFVILDKSASKCLGGVHLSPLLPFLSRFHAPANVILRAGENTAMVNYWLHDSFVDSDQAHQLIIACHHWLNEAWTLPDHYYRVTPTDMGLMHALEAADLRAQFNIKLPISPHLYTFYGA